MSKYQVLSPIKTPDGIVTDGYLDIPDKEVEELTRMGVIGDVEPVPVTNSKSKAKA